MDIIKLIENVSGFIWGGTWGDTVVIPGQIGPLAVVLLGTGLFMMVRLGARPILRFVPAVVEVWRGRKAQGEDGAITPWQALSTALSGQVGTGNLAGVATAITLGGPGAIFWMWVVALFGMALAFSESSLAIKYRETDEYGRINGGPMYYIKNGLGKGWGWLAVIFCLGTLFSAMATGSMIQANSITEAALETGSHMGVSIPNWSVGIILSVLVFAVIIGGIKSIGSFAGKVVPVMAGLYVLVAFIVLVINADKVPGAFMQIIGTAFGWKEAAGGAAGYGVMQAVRYGIARGLFSNEAGQGSAPIAHAAAQTKNPVQQGEIAMIGVFIDTIVICTMTALVILTVRGDFTAGGEAVAHAWQSDRVGFEMTSGAFAAAFPFEVGSIPIGTLVASIALLLFVFTTLLTWSYYGERAITFLYDRMKGSTREGEKKLHMVWRVLWCVVIFIGAAQPSELVWRLGDISNATMVLPNLLALALLSGVVFKLARGDRTAGKEFHEATPEEPEEY